MTKISDKRDALLERSKLWQVVLLLGLVGIFLGAGIKTVRKASDGRTAFVRWMPTTAAVQRGEIVYFRGRTEDASLEEGFPTPPLMLLILMPFHALGAVAGSAAWFLFKFTLMIASLWIVLNVSRGRGPPWPKWAMVLAVALIARPLIGDLTHGNVNILILSLIALALHSDARGRQVLAGTLIGLAAVIKVTPLLFLLYLAWKRQGRALSAAVVAMPVFLWLLPGLILGFEFNARMVLAWADQMIAPLLSDQTGIQHFGYHNQSLSALLHRLLGDVVAIGTGGRAGPEPVQINLLDLDSQSIGRIYLLLSSLLVGIVLFWTRGSRRRDSRLEQLGGYALVCLAMLLISPRSWKHHYVTLAFSYGFLIRYLLIGRTHGWPRNLPLAALVGAVILQSSSSYSLLGAEICNLAQAYGAYVFAALLLLAGIGYGLAAIRRGEHPLEITP